MSRFDSVVKTTINDVQLTRINQLKIKGMYNNNYQTYDEIDYNVPLVTTEPRDIINTSTCTKSSDLSEIYLNHIYGYYPHSTTTTTTVTSNQSAETVNDSGTLSQSEIKQFIQTITNDYPQFKSMLTLNIQHLGSLDSYVPQGVCSVDDLTLVSCYDGNKNNCPRILIIDPVQGRRWVDLNLSPSTHVGGITYDPLNNNIWVTGENGKIGCYNYNSIINNNGQVASSFLSFDGNITNDDGKKVASYMTYYDGKIYVGSFNQSSSGCVKEYTIDKKGSSLSLTNEFKVPPKTQGISFTKQNGKTHMAVSCSYGRTSDSSLKLYEYNDVSINKIDDIKMPPMLEQITFNQDGTLKCVFESSAEKYNGATVEIPSVCSLDIFSCLK